MKPLTITATATATDQAGTRMLVIAGEIDLATSTQFAAELTNALAPGTTLVLDLSAVTFMDAQGLRVLLAAHHGLAAPTTRLVLIPSPAVSRVLEITGADRYLNLSDPVDAPSSHYQPEW